MGNSVIAINAPRIYQVEDAMFCDSRGDTKIWKNLKNRTLTRGTRSRIVSKASKTKNITDSAGMVRDVDSSSKVIARNMSVPVIA